jgi:uncharacterized protein (DUF58 family)
MAGVSLLLLRYGLRESGVTVEPARMRMFKRQMRSVVLRLSTLGSGFARISSVKMIGPFGLEGEVGKLDRGVAELSIRAAYAGVFRGTRIAVTMTDALGLFTHTEESDPGMVVESLPRSLLLPDSPMPVSPIVQGEVSTGGRGAGQELYSIEPYQPGSDAKDVMWKRVARSGDDNLQVRVREASAKASVRILLMLGGMGEEDRVRYMDLASEAMAQLGKKLTSLGVMVEMAWSRDDQVTVSAASNPVELASAVTDLWSPKTFAGDVDLALLRTDLLVTDPKMLDDDRIKNFVKRRPVLLLWSGRPRQASGGSLFSFSGEDDLTQLAEVLLEG